MKERGLPHEARPLLERALHLDEQPTRDLAMLARDHYALGVLWQDLGDLEEARLLLERAVQLSKQGSGPQHPETARCLDGLGSVYRDLTQLELAQSAFESALQIDQAALGEAHPNVARDMNDLGVALQSAGNLVERAAFMKAPCNAMKRSLEQIIPMWRATWRTCLRQCAARVNMPPRARQRNAL